MTEVERIEQAARKMAHRLGVVYVSDPIKIKAFERPGNK